MTFRYARHSTDLQKMEQFYTQLVGLENLGGFKNHSSYDGIFLGYKTADWHLEFTSSPEKPQSKFDEDDALVFYVDSSSQLAKIKKTLQQKNINLEVPKNPYWVQNGIMISDPDGFKVIFSVRQLNLDSTDELTKQIKEQGIDTWNQLLDFTQNLPYGRNTNREDLSLVLKENKGTCSSKHAFLKKVADQNKIKHVQLILSLYHMNEVNTPKIGSTLLDNGLAYLPEAHCYLKLNHQRVDLTNAQSDMDNLAADIIEEIEIEPEQVNHFKVDFHKRYLKNWITENHIPLNFDKIWEIRERCIKQLEG